MTTSVRVPCILVALERERLALHDCYRITQRFADAPCPAFLCDHDGRSALIIETGVGAARTVRAVDWLASEPRLGDRLYQPSMLLMAGFAGALQASVSVGDLILAKEVVDLDGNFWSAIMNSAPITPDSSPTKRAGGAIDWKRGKVLTSNRFVGDPDEKLALGMKHQALAVDMESAAFARRSHEHGVPWVCLRVVSDDVHVPFTVEVAELVEDGRVKLGRVLSLLARKPWLLPKLLRLERQTRHAARRLAQGVIEFLACCSAG
jgi:adenosylhomocysteine nucleosidase